MTKRTVLCLSLSRPFSPLKFAFSIMKGFGRLGKIFKAKNQCISLSGRVAEWPNASDSKSEGGVSRPGVQIPPLPNLC